VKSIRRIKVKLQETIKPNNSNKTKVASSASNASTQNQQLSAELDLFQTHAESSNHTIKYSTQTTY